MVEEQRPQSFFQYLDQMTGRMTGLSLMLLLVGVVLLWLLGALFWPPGALLIPIILFALFVFGAAAFHYGLLPESPEWQTDDSVKEVRARTGVALGVTVCLFVFAVIFAKDL